MGKEALRGALHNKLTDCDGENSETDSSLDFARDCGYISPREHSVLVTMCQEIGRMLGSMMKRPSSFLVTGRDYRF
jgi:four helix bundle protein